MGKLNIGKDYKSEKIVMRSIPRRLFDDYFNKIAIKKVGDIYWGNDWKVKLSKEYQERLGPILIVTVEITIDIKKEKFDEFLFEFRKNFIRGGG